MELTDNFIVSVTDDEGRFDLTVRVFEVHILSEVCLSERLVVNYVTVVILDDQLEFFAGGVIELNLENYVIVIGANIFYGYLIVVERFGTTAIGFSYRGIANEYYEGGCCYCDCFYYRFHNLWNFILYELVNKVEQAGESLK